MPPSGVCVRKLTGKQELRPIHFQASLSEALGGICVGFSILLSGLPGSGKSTLAAELAAAMASKLDGVVFWLDREQLAEELIAACFGRTNASMDRVRVVGPSTDETASQITWRQALQAVAHGSRSIIVCDSLQSWADESDRERLALIKALRATKATSIVISQSNQEGHPFGVTTNQHATDAVVLVTPTEIQVPNKCRWATTPRSYTRTPREVY